MSRGLHRQAPTVDSLYLELAIGIEAAAGWLPAVQDDSPLWTAFPAQPGRGLKLLDGRMVSPQEMALDSPADELFFGGSPGGGKSQLLLGCALTRHRASAIFRRQFAQFSGEEGLLAKARDIIGLRGKQSRNTFRSLGGRRWSLEFLGCDYDKDVLKFKGRGHDFHGFDELPEFPERYYRQIIGWTRTEAAGQRTRVVASGNPPITEEGQWVLKYWGPWLDPQHPSPATDGELRWYVVDADGKDQECPGPRAGTERAPAVLVGGDQACEHEFDQHGERGCLQCLGRMVNPRSRTFIKSQAEDNPYLMATGYADTLDSLPEPLRSQMRFGNFQAAAGDHEWQGIPTAWVLAAQRRWRPDGRDGAPLSQVGNDVSRGGQDEFVVAKRHDNWVGPLSVTDAKRVPDGNLGAQRLREAIGADDPNGTVPVQIDADGVGCAVLDFAKLFRLKAVALNGGVKSRARPKGMPRVRFANKRAEWHWKMREILDPLSGLDYALPPDPQLRGDLCAWRYTIELGAIVVEPKDKIKARLGRSPDRGEAVIYASVPETTASAHGMLFEAAALSEADLDDEIGRLRRELGLAV